MPNQKNDFSFSVKRHIAELSRCGSVATRLNLVQFGKFAPKFDVRRWKVDADGSEIAPYNGMQYTFDEIRNLRDALNQLDELQNKGGD